MYLFVNCIIIFFPLIVIFHFLHLPHRHLVLRTLPGLKKEEFPCTSSPSSVVR